MKKRAGDAGRNRDEVPLPLEHLYFARTRKFRQVNRLPMTDAGRDLAAGSNRR